MKKIIINILSIILILFLLINICPTKTQAVNLDGIMSGADDFINKGTNGTNVIDQYQLEETSDLIYNILLGISMVLAVIVGMILGIKYMMSSTEEKAEIKETLIPYVVACVITFGAFTIWKIVINIIQ